MTTRSSTSTATTGGDDLANVSLLVREINSEIARAVALHALWERSRNSGDILDPVRKAKLVPFNLVRESVHKDLILTLMKLFDCGPADLSFPRVLGTPNLDSHAQNPEALRQTKEMLKATAASAHFAALKRLRNKILAHNDTRGQPTTATYRHHGTLLGNAIGCADLLSSALGCEPTFAVPTGKFWELEADRFWRAVALGTANLPPVPDEG